jgi:hypothetical protein
MTFMKCILFVTLPLSVVAQSMLARPQEERSIIVAGMIDL